MSTDYAKKKNAELEDLLKTRSLPHTGKKADLIARLQQYDAEQAATSNIATTAGAEDEIDWEDDVAAAEPTGAAAIAAGGLGQPTNPTAVPNQVVDTDPSKTNDLTVDPPAPTTEDTKAAASVEDVKATEADKKRSLPSTGIKATTLDDELAKRQKRAARFGNQESDEDALKAIERAKKFGTGDVGDRVAVKGLDEALPERAARGQKRGRGGDDGGRRDGREKRSKVRGGGRNGRERSGTPKDGVKKAGSGLSDKDRSAAEARKKRFAAMA
ncbi:hypothetical protein HO173_001126 [Letharia columbiana]|uniref:SAP domain-containing protein n=1 Tax=Letharia columbiana TaxID=112416 RepID=A0A8H6L9F9_9LECA|nr:uncharacterized protein HO173_001126 [Letharia columbiana]KAF6240458.1 hypothetical protein HO173_001126 [Letharia columbiana]